MKNLLVIAGTCLLAFQAQASDLFCEAWYQEAGQSLQKYRLSLQSETSNSTVFSGAFNGYDFKVDWNRDLSTFYVFIESAGKRILFTTARVPTLNHPENFTDLNIPGGPRLSVNCEMH
jgi:ABC-type proline/glycine betaine transport system substrate-binding protein